MKKIYYIVAVLVFSVTSCDDYLNTEPIDKISVKQYYTDEQGLTSGLVGVYDVLGSASLYGNNMYNAYNLCTDEGYFGRTVPSGDIQNLAVNIIDPTNAEITSLWSTCYVGVNRANDLIANINLPAMDETKRQVILGEALFLRGYFHFLLVTNFGNIPMKLEPTTNPNDVFTPATPISEVYAQIVKDMTAAESKVSTSTEMGYSSRVSKTVVQGILARVCLQMAGFPLNDTSKYSEALSWAKKVKDSGEHALRTTYNPSITGNNAYSQIFIDQAQDKYDVKESMWEIEFKGDGSDGYAETGRLGNTNGITFTGATLYATIGYSYGFVKGTARLYAAYKTGDKRRDWVLAPFKYDMASGNKTNYTATTVYGRDCAKWRREFELSTNKNKNNTAINFPVLRYADVLLMFAEAENQVNGPTAVAIEAVNQVRRRGFGLPIATASTVSDLAAANIASKAAFQLAIENERMLELCFEGTRHMDLIRWGKYVSTMNAVGLEIEAGGGTANSYGKLGGKNVTARNLLYPIPIRELSINKNLTQNEGW
jgi:hypothetical protein